MGIPGASQNAIASALDGLNSRADFHGYRLAGALTVAAGKPAICLPLAATLSSVRLVVGTAPTGADLIVDVLKNGVSVFSNASQRPKVVAGQTKGASVPISASVVDGDVISFDVTQIGSGTAGSDLLATVAFVPSSTTNYS
jgi:hypothetical protein